MGAGRQRGGGEGPGRQPAHPRGRLRGRPAAGGARGLREQAGAGGSVRSVVRGSSAGEVGGGTRPRGQGAEGLLAAAAAGRGAA